MKVLAIDIDGVLDIPDNVKIVNRLTMMKDNLVILHTARGEWYREETKSQLKEWGVKYHLLVMGKLKADFYIDDKSIGLKEVEEKLKLS